ncbi:MAG: hypothetical protein SGJ18_14445 [Pseudomonadota bacterium]|nr:hypothetical protein [Pseudomonadota bacterium]
MNTNRLHLQIAKQNINSVITFIDSWGREKEIPENLLTEISGSLGATLAMIVEKSNQWNANGEIRIDLFRKDNEFVIELLNSGIPLFPGDFEIYSARPQIEAARKRRGFSRLEFENCGRLGQKLTFGISTEVSSTPILKGSGVLERHSMDETIIRVLRPGEEKQLSRLFHKVYGYRYISDFVYYPEKIADMIKSGRLISLVAEMSDGSLAGHVGLLQLNDSPSVFEAALGLVDPSYKTNGLFGRIFSRLQEIKKGRDFQYCIYDFVTNHEFSQRLVSKFGYRDLALFLGSQVSETQARLSTLGIGQDAIDMDRYSLLVAVEPGVPHPFGKEISLPTQIGEATEFLLSPLGVTWVPISRFHPLMKEGDFSLKLQPEQKAAVFDFHKPGFQALEKIILKWRELLKDKYEYVAVDFPVNFSGLGQLYDILASHGFFMAGFVPYHYSTELAFRFQFLTPTKVSFDNIKMHSVDGRKLLAMVRADYERNTIL